MALNKDPRFGNAQKTAYCNVTSGTGIANTDLDDTPTGTTLLLTAPAGGAVITKLSALVKEPAASAAAQLSIYLSKDAGTTKRLIKSVAHAAYTYATTTAPTQDDFGFTEAAPMRLEAADQIYVQMRYASAVTDAASFKAEYSELQADA